MNPSDPGYFLMGGPHDGTGVPWGIVPLRDDGWPTEQIDMFDGSKYRLSRIILDGERRLLGAVFQHVQESE